MGAVMRLPRFDLPLRQSAASRCLPWALGGLLYLAVVALGVAAIADEALRSNGMPIRMVTVTLPAFDGGGDSQDLAEALGILRNTRGVTSAVPVPVAEVAILVEPWMGDLEAGMDLPLPRLIDVTLDPRSQVDLAALERRLAQSIEGATVGAEVSSRDRAEQFAAFLRAWALAGGIAALVLMLVLVALITWASLRMSADSVEVLRCMGAPDRYLARQFEGHALLSWVQGGLVGLVLALLTVLALLDSSARMQLADAVEPHLPALDWLLLATVPVLAALPIMAAARLTALWVLTRTP
jgi:cell division transport system permease protein